MKCKAGKFQNGFTLIEVILAIFVLTVAVASSFILISQTLTSASLAQSNLIAAYLAQEGIEIVKSIRDTNWLKIYMGENVSWDKGISDTLAVGGRQDYIADYNTLADSARPPVLSSFEDKKLNLISGGFYGYSSGSPSSFKRKISISKIARNEISVLIDITWQERGRTHSFKVADKFYEQEYE